MFTVSLGFSYIYAVGDGVVIQASTVCALHRHVKFKNEDEQWQQEQRPPDEGELLRKPYMIAIAAMLEGAMHDLLVGGVAGIPCDFGFPGLSKEERKQLNKKYTQPRKPGLTALAGDFASLQLLGGGTHIYDQINNLFDARNNIHISKEPMSFLKLNPKNYTCESVSAAEKTAEYVLKCLSRNFARGGIEYVPPVTLPWDEHVHENDVPVLGFKDKPYVRMYD